MRNYIIATQKFYVKGISWPAGRRTATPRSANCWRAGASAAAMKSPVG